MMERGRKGIVAGETHQLGGLGPLVCLFKHFGKIYVYRMIIYMDRQAERYL